MRLAAVALRVLFGVVGAVLVAIAVFTNAEYWSWVYRSDPTNQAMYVGFSLVADATKLIVPACMALWRIKFRNHVELSSVFVVAFVFSIFSGAGYVQMTRDAAAAGGQVLENRRGNLETAASALQSKLKPLPPAGRAVAQVQADLAAAEAVAPKNSKGEACVSTGASRHELCLPVFKLRAELATEQTRSKLEGELAPLAKEIAELPPKRNAEPGIAAVGEFLRGFSARMTDSVLTRALSAVRLLLIELCPAAIALFVLRPPPLPAAPIQLGQPKRAPRSPDRAAGLLRSAGADPPAVAKAHATRLPAATGGSLLDLLRLVQPGADGWITTTQRALGEQVGLSAAEINRQLAALELRRAIEMQASRRGTRIKVLVQPGSAKVVALRA